MTDTGRFEGRMMAEGRQIDAVGPGHVQNALVGLGFNGLVVDLNPDQCGFLPAGHC